MAASSSDAATGSPPKPPPEGVFPAEGGNRYSCKLNTAVQLADGTQVSLQTGHMTFSTPTDAATALAMLCTKLDKALPAVTYGEAAPVNEDVTKWLEETSWAEILAGFGTPLVVRSDGTALSPSKRAKISNKPISHRPKLATYDEGAANFQKTTQDAPKTSRSYMRLLIREHRAAKLAAAQAARAAGAGAEAEAEAEPEEAEAEVDEPEQQAPPELEPEEEGQEELEIETALGSWEALIKAINGYTADALRRHLPASFTERGADAVDTLIRSTSARAYTELRAAIDRIILDAVKAAEGS